MEVKAKLSNLRVSPRKVRLVANLVKKMVVADAEAQLQFTNKGSALILKKLLLSAVANAEHNFKLNRNNLIVKNILVNEGATLKRWKPRAQGRATPIKKKSCHVTIVLSEKKTKLK